MYNPYDYYFKQAKKSGYKARSAFKLQEIDSKYKIFTKNTKNICDIGCAPGSWLQYTHKRLLELGSKDFKVIGFDILSVSISLQGVFVYNQDISNANQVEDAIKNHEIEYFDVILSDMAPNTIGLKQVDAIRSINLLKKTIWIYEKYLKSDGKFVIKVFTGPGFDEFVKTLKTMFGGKNMKIFKPQACRTESKETYIIRY